MTQPVPTCDDDLPDIEDLGRQYFADQIEKIRWMRRNRDAPVDSLEAQGRSAWPALHFFYSIGHVGAAPNVKRFHILVSLMLSSQTRDEVNIKCMKRLYARGCTVESILDMDLVELMDLLYPVCFYRTKAKHLKAACEMLKAWHEGSSTPYAYHTPRMPASGSEALQDLPGEDEQSEEVLGGVPPLRAISPRFETPEITTPTGLTFNLEAHADEVDEFSPRSEATEHGRFARAEADMRLQADIKQECVKLEKGESTEIISASLPPPNSLSLRSGAPEESQHAVEDAHSEMSIKRDSSETSQKYPSHDVELKDAIDALDDFSAQPKKRQKTEEKPLGSDGEREDLQGIENKYLQSDYDVPKTFEDVCKLPGVGPKMATLLMQLAWGQTVGIAVDLHVHRISNRLRWVTTTSPEATKAELEKFVPENLWRDVNLLLVGFGQQICKKRSPKCKKCDIFTTCPFGRQLVAIKTHKSQK